MPTSNTLTWKDVSANFGAGGDGGANFGNIIQNSMEPLRRSLLEERLRADKSYSMDQIQKALTMQDPDAVRGALASGAIDMDEYNANFFSDYTSKLLDDNLKKLTTAATLKESAAALESRKITDEGSRLSNISAGQTIEDNKIKLEKNLHDWNKQLEQETVLPNVLKQVAQLQDMATGGNPEGALKIARTPEFVELAVKGGLTEERLNGLRESFYASAQQARTEEKNAYDTNREKRRRGGTAREEDIKLETDIITAEQGLETAESDAVTKALERAGKAESNEAAAFVLENKEKILKGYPTPREMLLAVDALPGSTLGKAALKDAIKQAETSIPNMTPEELEIFNYERNPNAPRGQRTRTDATTFAGGFTDLITATESGRGGYRAMYGQAQDDPNSEYNGLDIRTMSIAQLDNLANDGGYKAWVAARNNGVEASPFGKYQIVNNTLQEAARELGLDPNTKFDEATQDMIFKHLLDKRLGSGRGDINATLKGVRQEWEGLKRVDDQTLLKAIQDYQSGAVARDRIGPQGNQVLDAGLSLALQGIGAGKTYPIDETRGEAATKFIQEIVADPGPIDPQKWDIVTDIVAEADNRATAQNQKLMADNIFGGNIPGLMAAIQDPANQNLLSSAVAKQLKAAYPDMDEGNLTTDLNTLSKESGLQPGIVAAFMLAAPQENMWLLSDAAGIQDPRKVNMDAVRDLMKEFVTPGASSGENTAGIMAQLEQIRAKTAASGELAAVQQRVRQATADLAQASYRIAQGETQLSDKAAKIRLEQALAAQDELIKRIDASSIYSAQGAGVGAQAQ